MSEQVGGVGYNIDITANAQQFVKSIEKSMESVDRLEKTVSSLSSNLEKSFNSFGGSANKASTAAANSMKKVEKSITPTIATLDRLQDKYAQVSKSSQRIGDATKTFNSVEKAMEGFIKRTEEGFKSTQEMTAASAALSRQMTRAEQENKKYERAMLAVQKSVSGAERQVATMTRRMQAMGDSEKPVNDLTQALQRYKNEMTDAAGDAIATAKAQERFASSTDNAKRELEEMNDRLRRYARETDNARRGTGNLSGAMGALIASTGAFVSAYNAIEILRMADQYTNMANRLSVVSDETTNVANQMRTLLGVAIDARSTLDGVTDVYSKLTRANERYGKSQEEILTITTAVSQAVSMSGATAQGAEGALIQFAQAISNNFQAAAQEINSINEQTPALSQAIALALSSTGKYGEVAANDLKRLASEGRLSAGDLLDGFVNVADQIEERFGQATLTMAQGFVALKDSAVTSLGEVGRATGITESIAKAMQDLAKSSGEAAAGIAGIGAGLGTMAAAIGVAGIVGLFAIMGPLATGIAGVGVALSGLVGVFAKNTAEAALMEQKFQDSRDSTKALLNSVFDLTNEKYSWEDSSFSAWLKDSNDSIADTRENITQLEEDILRLATQDSSFFDQLLGSLGASVGLEWGSVADQVELTNNRTERQIDLNDELAQKLVQGVELAKRFNDERFGTLTSDMNEALAAITRENDAQLVAISSVKSAAEDYYRFVSENADKGLLDVRRAQIAEGMLRDLGFEADNIGVVIDSNKDVIDAALIMMAQGFSSTEEVVGYLNDNLNTNAELVAKSEEEIASLYQGMDNASGATAMFSAEIARLGQVMMAAAAVGNTEMVGMIREIIIEMNKQYNATLENMDANNKGDTSRKKSEKSIDSLVNKYHELNDVLAQQSALASSGIEGVLDLQALQEEEKAIRDIQKTLSELSSSEMQKFAKEAGVVTKAGESVEDAMIRMTRETSSFQEQLKEQEAASKTVTDGFKDIVDAYEEASVGLSALMNGTEAYNRALANLEVSRKVDEMAEAFNKLNPVDQAAKLAVLSEAFGIVGLTVENLPEKLTEALKGIDQINRDIESQMKIAEAAEKEAARFGEAWTSGMNNLADTFKDGLLNMEDGFSGFADSLKNSFKDMLLDLAYEAYIRPIVVGFQSDMSGVMSGQGAGGKGGLSQTVSAAKGVYNSFTGGSAGVGGLYTNAATSSAGTLYGSAQTGAAIGSGATQGGFMSSIGSTASTLGPYYALASIGNSLFEGAGLYDMLGIDTDGDASQLLGTIAPIGGTIIGGALDGLFGSSPTPFSGRFGTRAETRDFEHQGNESSEGQFYRQSAFGTVGFFDKGTERLQRAGTGNKEWADELAASTAEMDNLVASLAQTTPEMNAMRNAVQSMQISSRNAADVIEFALEDRPRAAINAMTGDFGEFVQSLEGGIEQIVSEAQFAQQSLGLMQSSMKRLNLNFDDSGAAAYGAASNIANFAGGIDNLANLQSSYYDTFFTEAERAANLQDDLTSSLSSMGMELPSTLQGFRDLIEAQNLNTVSGQQNYSQLLQLAGGFSQLQQMMGEVTQSVEDFSQAIQQRESLERELLGLQGNTAELRRRELSDLAELAGAEEQGLMSIQKRIWALEDEQIANERSQEEIAKANENAMERLTNANTNFSNAISDVEKAYNSFVKSIESERNTITKSYELQKEGIQDNISTVQEGIRKTEQMVNSLSSALDQMLKSSVIDQQANFERSSRFLSSTLLSRDFSDSEGIEKALSVVTNPSTDTYETLEDYKKDFLSTANVISKMQEETGDQLSVQQRTLNALESQLERAEIMFNAEMERLDLQIENQRAFIENQLGELEFLEQIKDGILTIPDALSAISDAVSSAITAQQKVTDAATGAVGGNPNFYLEAKTQQLNRDGYQGKTWTVEDTVAAFERDGLSVEEHYARYGQYENIPGFASGGISTGPKSGYPVELHGTEAVVPLSGGNIPVSINWNNMPQSNSTGISSFISSDASSSSDSITREEVIELLSEIRNSNNESNEITYEMLVYIMKMFKIEQRWEIEGVRINNDE